MQNYKRLLAIVLAMLLVIPFALCSCDPDPTTSTSSSASSTDGTSSTEEEDPFVVATGLERKDWSVDGEPRVIKILSLGGDTGYYNREIATNQVDADEFSGEKVYEAVAERERVLEEQFGIKIEVYFTDSTSGNPTSWLATNYMTGDSEYQIIGDSLLRIAASAQNGHLYKLNLFEEKGLDTSKSFWDQTAIQDLSIANQLYFLTGDIVVTDDQSTWACFFNKDIINDHNYDSPYELVANNEWTIDKLYQMAKDYGSQNVNSSDIDWENGHYGLVAQTYDGLSSMTSVGERMVAKDAQDLPYFNMKSQSLVNKFEKVYNLLTEKNTAILAEKIANWKDDPYTKANRIFFENRALFQYQKVQYVNDLANEKVNFGIVPMPKYDSNQENYHSTATVYWSLFLGVPMNIATADIDVTAYTLQAMAYYGQTLLTPAYYQDTIKSQKTQDPESEEMLDLIFANRVYDIASVFNFEDALYVYTNVLTGSSNNLVSRIDSAEGKINTAIQATIDAFSK